MAPVWNSHRHVRRCSARLPATHIAWQPARLGCRGGAREINLFWTQSVDNQTPQASIVYEVYQNGVLDHTIIGVGRTILYANQAGENTFTVIAVDEAGNKSAPASHIIVSQ